MEKQKKGSSDCEIIDIVPFIKNRKKTDSEFDEPQDGIPQRKKSDEILKKLADITTDELAGMLFALNEFDIDLLDGMDPIDLVDELVMRSLTFLTISEQVFLKKS